MSVEAVCADMKELALHPSHAKKVLARTRELRDYALAVILLGTLSGLAVGVSMPLTLAGAAELFYEIPVPVRTTIIGIAIGLFIGLLGGALLTALFWISMSTSYYLLARALGGKLSYEPFVLHQILPLLALTLLFSFSLIPSALAIFIDVNLASYFFAGAMLIIAGYECYLEMNCISAQAGLGKKRALAVSAIPFLLIFVTSLFLGAVLSIPT